jgi:hypothetical protein
MYSCKGYAIVAILRNIGQKPTVQLIWVIKNDFLFTTKNSIVQMNNKVEKIRLLA